MSSDIVIPQLKKFILHVLNGPNKGVKFQVSGTIKIGSHESNDICLQGDPDIRTHHVKFFVVNEDFYIQSLDEEHPITINKKNY